MLADVCENAGFIIRITVQLVKILHYVIPILLIALISFDLFKAVTSQLDDKAKKDAFGKAAKRLLYAIIVFFIPTIITLVFTSVNNLITKNDSLESTSVSWLDCWLKEYSGISTSYGGTDFSPRATSIVTPRPTNTPKPTAAPTSTPEIAKEVYDYYQDKKIVTSVPGDESKIDAPFSCEVRTIGLPGDEKNSLVCRSQISGIFYYDNQSDGIDWVAFSNPIECTYNADYPEDCYGTFASNTGSQVDGKISVQFNPDNTENYKTSRRVYTVSTH